MSKVSKRRMVAMPTVAQHKAIAAAAKADPDAQPLTPKQLQAMVPMKAVRGRPNDGALQQYVARHSRRA